MRRQTKAAQPNRTPILVERSKTSLLSTNASLSRDLYQATLCSLSTLLKLRDSRNSLYLYPSQASLSEYCQFRRVPKRPGTEAQSRRSVRELPETTRDVRG